MDSLVQEPLASHKDGEQTVRVLAAGNDEFRRSVALALDVPDVALVDSAATTDAVLDKVAEGGIDCIVLDKSVGASSSLELCERLARKLRSPPAMVLLTEDAGAKTVLKAFRTGLSDVVSRDQNYASELRVAVRRSTERSRKARELNEEVDYLAKLAKSDRLTGLANRAFLEDRLAAMAASGERHGGSFAVFLIDVDNFRQINDIYGHAIGDQALKAFGRRLMLTSRASDSFGRFGGDEFLYLIDRVASDETVAMVCERLARALTFSIDLETVGLSLSANIGAAIFPSDGGTVDALLAAASTAVARARRQARRYCLAHDAMTSLADEMNHKAANSDREQAGSRAEAQRDGAFDGPSARAGDGDSAFRHRDENRRVEHRNRVFKRGRIIFGDGFSTIDCVVRDISGHGARISFEDQVALPPRFTFSLSDSRTSYPAVQRWQRGNSIGIEFWMEDAPGNGRSQAPDARG